MKTRVNISQFYAEKEVWVLRNYKESSYLWQNLRAKIAMSFAKSECLEVSTSWWLDLLNKKSINKLGSRLWLCNKLCVIIRARENRISFGPRPKFRNWDRLETAKSPKKSVPYWPNTKEIFSDSVRYLGYSQILNLT